MIRVITPDNELTAPLFARAFAGGCGGIVVKEYTPGDPWAGFGSPQTWAGLMKAQKDGCDWYYGDHAYFGRGAYYRVTKNAYQHTGQGKPNMVKLRKHVPAAAAWKRDGGHIVVCPQSENFHERFGNANWLEDTISEIKKFTDRKIIWRTKKSKNPLGHDLKGAWAVVTHSSNAAVEAILRGVPAFCLAPCAASIMARDDLSLIEKPLYPDGRMEWAGVLAANQWTLEEIKTGKCWRHLNA